MEQQHHPHGDTHSQSGRENLGSGTPRAVKEKGGIMLVPETGK